MIFSFQSLSNLRRHHPIEYCRQWALRDERLSQSMLAVQMNSSLTRKVLSQTICHEHRNCKGKGETKKKGGQKSHIILSSTVLFQFHFLCAVAHTSKGFKLSQFFVIMTSLMRSRTAAHMNMMRPTAHTPTYTHTLLTEAISVQVHSVPYPSSFLCKMQ